MSIGLIDTNVPINSWFEKLNNYANSAVDSANAAVDSITSSILQPIPSSVIFIPVETNISTGTVTKPVDPSISLPNRIPVSPPTIDNISIDIGSAPEYNIIEPVINMPSVPSPLDAMAPVKDFIINTDFIYPIEPDSTLPSVPTLVDINIPTPLDLLIPIFDQALPTSNDIVIPGITFSFSENIYSSSLLTSIRSELLSRLQGGTGLNPIVEDALWNRGRDREQKASLQAERTLLVERGQIGFSRPTGSQLAALSQVVQDTQSKVIELSREIMIKQAELEQENIKTSIQQTISLEDILMRENNNTNQRTFDTAKYLQDVAIEIFKLAVSKFNSELEAYKSFAAAYQARVQAELAKIEIFKGKIEAEKLKGDINEQNIRLYLARIEGVKNNVEIYKSLILSISEKLKGEQLKLEVYKTDVTAYSEIAKAKSYEYSMYADQVKGELSKTQILESQTKAFASRIQAYATTSDAIIKKAEVDSSIQDLKIKKYTADIDAFIKQVQADQAMYASAVDLYKGKVQMYLGDVSMVNSSAELALKQAENIILQNKNAADIGIENSKIALSAVIGSYDALLESKKAAGSIHAQIAASALSAINVSASTGSSFDNNRSQTEDISA
jgi:hypothetical protein